MRFSTQIERQDYPYGRAFAFRQIAVPGGTQNCGQAGVCQAVGAQEILFMQSWWRANQTATSHVVKKFFDG